MQLYLIRHAESRNNAVPTYERTEDPSITSIGRLQSKCLGDWTKTLSYDHLITSPFLRAIQTTQAVLDAKKSKVQVWDNIFERGGCYRGYNEDNVEAAEGLGRSEIRQHLDGYSDRIEIDDTIPESGWWSGRARETDEEAVERTRVIADRLVSEFTQGECVLLVTHADFKRLLLWRMLNPNVDPIRFGALRNTGVTRVNYTDGQWQLDYFNSVSHLPARLITGNEH